MTNEHQIILDKRSIQRIHGVTALIAIAAVLFYLFFQINKGGPFRQVNPFGVDPYDAVGSFAFQGALLVGVLTYARSLRLWELPALANRARLVLHGNLVVLAAIWITLIAYAIAEFLSPTPPSYWGNVLRIELGLMVLLTLVCTVTLWEVFGRIQTAAPPPDLTPADGIDDLWTLVRVPVAKAGAHLPQGVVTWVAGFNSDRFFCQASLDQPAFPSLALCLRIEPAGRVGAGFGSIAGRPAAQPGDRPDSDGDLYLRRAGRHSFRLRYLRRLPRLATSFQYKGLTGEIG